MGILLVALFTAGSITQIFALIFRTEDDDLDRIPENIDIIMTIRNTAKVIPTNKAVNLLLSLTRSFHAILRIPDTYNNLLIHNNIKS
jgi:hypothetical protein